MTERIAKRVKRRDGGMVRMTLASSLAAAVLMAASAHGQPEWPDPRYQDNPVAFAHEVLGLETWDKQREILMALAEERARVSVRSGHKVSKTHSGAIAALWFVCSFVDARVTLTAPTSRQVDRILWREIRKLYSRSKLPLGGDLHELARSGLRYEDFREIVGFTAKEAEAVAGISGPNLLYIPDEASGVPDQIFEAIEGNRAGGARVLMLSNPTRCEGEFYRSHTDKKEFYTTFHVSSEDSPNVIEGRIVIPGLATREWVEEKRQEWGVESAIYQVRVAGNFPAGEATRVIPLHLITEAEDCWEDTDAVGRLHLGLDVARLGDDDAAGAIRRGDKVTELKIWPPELRRQWGLNAEKRLAEEAIQLVRAHRKKREQKPVIKVDCCGTIGMKVTGFLLAYRDEVDIIPVNVAEKAPLRREYPLLRDQLWFNLRRWLAEGGTLPTDSKLAAELSLPSFKYDEAGRRKVESKDKLREKLKRSPDRADAVGLAVWEPAAIRPQLSQEEREVSHLDAYEEHRRGFDAYASVDWIGGGQ